MKVIDWLIKGSDPSIQYQVYRDLLKKPSAETNQFKQKISKKGWGSQLLKHRNENGHWGNGFYNPKWTCTHYVLYEMTQLEIDNNNPECIESTSLILSCPIGKDGGINYAKTVDYSDVCINGMILTITSYFNIQNEIIKEIVDYLLKVQMIDGGWNCEYHHGAKHSSLHTTISVLEGFESYFYNEVIYREKEIRIAVEQAVEFILKHYLYKSDKTGELINKEFLKYYFPIRWKYDILRCLDLFRKYEIAYNERMDEAIELIKQACNKESKWKLSIQPGKTFFAMEKPGSESKWNTLRALRVLVHYKRHHAFV